MQLSKRKAIQESAEKLRSYRINYKRQRQHDLEVAEEAVRKQIAKNNKEKHQTFSEDVFLKTIAEKAPKLVQDEVYLTIVKKIEELEHVRNIKDWKPKGKSKDSQFISLASYLLAKYPTPKFLWSVFYASSTVDFEFVDKIAKGESFANMCKTGEFPLPLTKKQCHEFLQSTSEYTFLSAIRRIQVKSHGGDARLHSAWMSQRVGSFLHNTKEEVFWDSVLAWFSKNPMLDLNQLPTIIDYITHKHNRDDSFSMKGRSALAMLRNVEEWHKELRKTGDSKQCTYLKSGFSDKNYVTKPKENGNIVVKNWSIKEILTSKQLADEGRSLKHCVYSYSDSILKGNVSIWSMCCDNERVITIEVRNNAKKIIQARGLYNRTISSAEFKVLQAWASDNGLEISIVGF